VRDFVFGGEAAEVSNQPKRIQRRRSRGWRTPPNTIYVGRPTKWGNPYEVGVAFATATEAVAAYLTYVSANGYIDEIRAELRGKDLSCWCRAGAPCHADVLLEIANR
jgi:hypothetical protein